MQSDKISAITNLFEEALRELRHAEQNFQNADTGFQDAAIYDLKAKQMKINALLKLARTGGVDNG